MRASGASPRWRAGADGKQRRRLPTKPEPPEAQLSLAIVWPELKQRPNRKRSSNSILRRSYGSGALNSWPRWNRRLPVLTLPVLETLVALRIAYSACSKPRVLHGSGRLAQLVRALCSHRRGHRFEFCIAHSLLVLVT